MIKRRKEKNATKNNNYRNCQRSPHNKYGNCKLAIATANKKIIMKSEQEVIKRRKEKTQLKIISTEIVKGVRIISMLTAS